MQMVAGTSAAAAQLWELWALAPLAGILAVAGSLAVAERLLLLGRRVEGRLAVAGTWAVEGRLAVAVAGTLAVEGRLGLAVQGRLAVAGGLAGADRLVVAEGSTSRQQLLDHGLLGDHQLPKVLQLLKLCRGKLLPRPLGLALLTSESQMTLTATRNQKKYQVTIDKQIN